jgi:DNA-binding SARP family transcriptional activator
MADEHGFPRRLLTRANDQGWRSPAGHGAITDRSPRSWDSNHRLPSRRLVRGPACYGLRVGATAELAILGPFELRLGGETVALGGVRQRALLAILILHANEVVSTDRLVDQLWGETPPATAVHTVQVFVSRLRNALGSAGSRLITRPPGYLLEVGVDEVDADRCERLYADARVAMAAGEPTRAAELLRDADGLWRGPPLAEFTYEPFAQATIARLEELRVSCQEELIEAELALGRHAEIVSDLEALVRKHPFRERPRAQLMLALYRSGRQAEALDAFQQARKTLVEELAVEPSTGLRELEQAILRQEESIRAPPAAERTAVRATAEPEPDMPMRAPTASVTRPSTGIVRKTVTVLAATLSGRGPGGRADPETARRLIAIAREQAEEIVLRHGGAFVSGLGGEVVAVFGLPLTKEDDALRALRAADDLRSRMCSLSAGELGELSIRAGVDTGEVVAEAPDDLFGEPLSAGIALARAAGDTDVLLSDATLRLASDAIRVEPALDGSAWRLLDIVAGAQAFRRRLEIPIVDRDGELAAAHTVFARAAREGTPEQLTVLGEAGIGKSRLAQEFSDQLGDQATVLTGRCLSYGEGIAFWALREALTPTAGGESPEAIRRLLGDAADAELVANIVAGALGLAAAEGAGEQVPWAFRRLFDALAAQHPVLLVIEDVHWAEPPLLDLIDYLVDWLTGPVLVLCLARPELLDTRPGWGGGRPRVSSRVLHPLGDEDALQLLDRQLGERKLTSEESAQILETAEGNPLFVEQLLALSTEDPWWDQEREIPATIQSLLAARIDRLGPGERTVIERAAVIGREFWPSAVVELLPSEARPSAAEHVRALVHRGLIHPDRTMLPGEDALRFHHILIRDVAYRSTPKMLRSELHERFGDWLAQRGEGYDEIVGYHLEQAFRYRSELGSPDASALALAARAGECLAAGGRRALSRGDTNAAVTLLRAAAELSEISGNKRPDVLLDLGSAVSESGDFRGAERILQTALEQARATHAEALSERALIQLSYWHSRVDPSARVREMLTVAEHALAVFDRIGDQGGLSRAWLHIAWAHWIQSHCAEMEPALERALKHAERAGERREGPRILSDMARATVIGPRPVDDGIGRCTMILERAAGDVAPTAFTEAMLAVLEAMDGRFGEARDRWRNSKRRLADVGLSFTVAVVQMYYAFIELLAGTPERAESEVAEACTVFEGIGDQGRLSSAAALLARLLYAQQRYAESEQYCRISEETASADDVVSQVLWRGTRAKVLARAGVTTDAEQLVNSGVAQAEATDFLMLHGDALGDRAEVLAIMSRPETAGRDLEHAIALYQRKGIRASADAARRIHGSLASGACASVADPGGLT